MDRISLITALFSRALVLKSIGGDSLSYIGVTTTALSDGATTNPITIDGDTVTATNGNVALYGGDAFVFNGTIWQASSAISQIFTEIGDLSDLDTEAKTDLVSAINEVNEEKQDDVELSLTPTAVVSDRDIQDGQGNTLSVLAEALTKTASGNPVVISDCAGGKARSLITEINAIQDLHGLPFPYVGGAYKNLVELHMTEREVYGVTYTKNSDGSFSLNGVATGNINFRVDQDNTGSVVNPKTWAAGTYAMSKSTTKFRLVVMQDSTFTTIMSLEANDTSGTVTLADTVNNCFTFISINSGTRFDNEKFYIQIEKGNQATPWTPWENICPISGRTETTVTVSDGDEISEDFTIQLGTTVYGADINWDTGVMDLLTACDVYDGSDDENWTRYNSGSASAYAMTIHTAYEHKFVQANDNIITNYLKALSTTETWGNYDTFITSNGNTNIITGMRDITTVEAWKAYLANNPLQIEYELADKPTIQLTPTQLQMLKGYNRVTIDNGTITLDYIAKAISGNDEEIAPLVGDKATKSYSVNDFIERADGLYRVTAPIASGASFTANNTVKMSIGEALTYLYNK